MIGMKEKVGEVFSIANDNRPVAGCTISKEVHSGENYITYFSLARNTDISAEIYPYHKLLIVADGSLEVYGTDSYSGIEYMTLDDLFERSDIISLHCPLTDETRHMIGTAAIDKMKKGVVIVNTSRGGLIDAEALLEGIKARKIGAACLDVYEEEADVFFEDRSGHILNDDLLSRLISMPNVIVTSHQAFLTEEALKNIAETTVNNILSYFNNDGICDNAAL